MPRIVFGLFISLLGAAVCFSQQQLTHDEAVATMKKAAVFYHEQVASHGGYVYHYSLDLEKRWGEGEATRSQIWVQPPGTPTVGMAFLRAYQSTKDPF